MASLSRSVRRFAIVGTSLIVRSEILLCVRRSDMVATDPARLFESAGRLAIFDAMSRPKLKSLEKDTANVLRTRSVDRNPSV
jgi:hypothetical protein